MIRCEDIPPKIFSNDSFAFTLQNETKFDTVIRYYCAAGYSFDDNIKSISSACEIDTKTNVSASWSIPLISKNFNCIDIDECLLNKTICSNDLHISAIECNNIKGSYICECSRGRQKRVNVTTVPCIASPSANITLI